MILLSHVVTVTHSGTWLMPPSEGPISPSITLQCEVVNQFRFLKSWNSTNPDQFLKFAQDFGFNPYSNVQTLQLCSPVQGYLQWKLARKITKTCQLRQLFNTILPISTVLIRKRTKKLLASLTARQYSEGILFLSENSRQVYPLKNSIVCILVA